MFPLTGTGKGLRRGVVCEIVAARHPQLGGIVGVGSPPVGLAQVLRRIVNLPVPPVPYENRTAANALFRDIYNTVKNYDTAKLVMKIFSGRMALEA